MPVHQFALAFFWGWILVKANVSTLFPLVWMEMKMNVSSCYMRLAIMDE